MRTLTILVAVATVLLVAFVIVLLIALRLNVREGDQTSLTSEPEHTEGPDKDTPVLVGAGDISSSNPNDAETAKLLNDIPGDVITLGDNAYPSGTAKQFEAYYQPTWGQHKARTHPTPGNHDYLSSAASGYYAYFGSNAGPPDKGYYSYDLGSWHVVSLNSNCERIGGCSDTDPQAAWLKKDLAAYTGSCTLAYWHHSLFSSGSAHGNDSRMRPAFQILYDNDSEVILSGHDHDYERFAPQTPSATADASRGIREFVVGTGGRSLNPFGKVRANSQVRNADTFGVLKLTLHPNAYDWKFVPVEGKSFTDSGTGMCH